MYEVKPKPHQWDSLKCDHIDKSDNITLIFQFNFPNILVGVPC